MTIHEPTSLVQGLLAKWREHRSARAAIDELAACDPEVLAEVSRDIQISVEDLREITAKGAGADRLMARMMAAYGIDADDLRLEAPSLLRDVAVLCSKCEAKGRCARELDAGTAAAHAHEFCPNAETFDSLR
ncbi:MAG: DUF6455 family protein [Mesorhizobium sp.]|nr:DUF6455 family protein [Mesorhizobium sp.]